MECSPTEFLDLAIVDHDLAPWEGLASLFERAGVRLRTFADSNAFLLEARHPNPDCVILDAGVPPTSGLGVLTALGGASYPVPVFLTSDCADIPMAVAAIKAGAYDLIEKPFSAPFVIDQIREAVRKNRSTVRVIPWLRLALSADLTRREVEVLQHLVGGATNKAAARLLTISPRTVEVHRARLMEKLGARNTADLMRIVLT